jgi:CRP-like cAMP-binding protein
MQSPLTRKLEQYVRLSGADCDALHRIAGQGIRTLRAREDILREGDSPRAVNLIVEGWACRYKMLEDGRRQLIAFFLPGDLCDLNIFILRKMDHSVGTITPVRYVQLTREAFDRLAEDHPRVLQALWWDSLVTSAIQREWTVNLGQRSALERIAHLVCELFMRAKGVGLTRDNAMDFPPTQNDLSEATGMTPVHVNRTVQEMRSRGLIHWHGKRIEIPYWDGLCEVAMFNSNYLHLDHEGAHLDANE